MRQKFCVSLIISIHAFNKNPVTFYTQYKRQCCPVNSITDTKYTTTTTKTIKHEQSKRIFKRTIREYRNRKIVPLQLISTERQLQPSRNRGFFAG